eukprot:gnl/Chilomastix_cuspidata/2116.p1 GENE.gnl/Chilomastix_cuspidata/2116~~gnl/Chilomastix_cuspidata/2116.p1  ORF type:complete len:1330 (+),score=644.39 gnl/Chilomastix_cuspidata/2116:373-4362(+)
MASPDPQAGQPDTEADLRRMLSPDRPFVPPTAPFCEPQKDISRLRVVLSERLEALRAPEHWAPEARALLDELARTARLEREHDDSADFTPYHVNWSGLLGPVVDIQYLPVPFQNTTPARDGFAPSEPHIRQIPSTTATYRIYYLMPAPGALDWPLALVWEPVLARDAAGEPFLTFRYTLAGHARDALHVYLKDLGSTERVALCLSDSLAGLVGVYKDASYAKNFNQITMRDLLVQQAGVLTLLYGMHLFRQTRAHGADSLGEPVVTDVADCFRFIRANLRAVNKLNPLTIQLTPGDARKIATTRRSQVPDAALLVTPTIYIKGRAIAARSLFQHLLQRAFCTDKACKDVIEFLVTLSTKIGLLVGADEGADAHAAPGEDRTPSYFKSHPLPLPATVGTPFFPHIVRSGRCGKGVEPRLRTLPITFALHEHQCWAVDWMFSAEQRGVLLTVGGPNALQNLHVDIPVNKVGKRAAHSRLYMYNVHYVTSRMTMYGFGSLAVSPTPPPSLVSCVCRGGVLANETGSGKTFSALSLQLLAKHAPDQPEAPYTGLRTAPCFQHCIETPATLVLLPQHLLSHWILELKKITGDSTLCANRAPPATGASPLRCNRPKSVFVYIESGEDLARTTVSMVRNADFVVTSYDFLAQPAADRFAYAPPAMGERALPAQGGALSALCREAISARAFRAMNAQLGETTGFLASLFAVYPREIADDCRGPSLFHFKWRRVVCDEAQDIHRSPLFHVLNLLICKYFWFVSATPVRQFIPHLVTRYRTDYTQLSHTTAPESQAAFSKEGELNEIAGRLVQRKFEANYNGGMVGIVRSPFPGARQLVVRLRMTSEEEALYRTISQDRDEKQQIMIASHHNIIDAGGRVGEAAAVDIVRLAPRTPEEVIGLITQKHRQNLAAQIGTLHALVLEYNRIVSTPQERLVVVEDEAEAELDYSHEPEMLRNWKHLVIGPRDSRALSAYQRIIEENIAQGRTFRSAESHAPQAGSRAGGEADGPNGFLVPYALNVSEAYAKYERLHAKFRYALQMAKVLHDPSTEECSICLDVLEFPLVVLPCSHVFHDTCLQEALAVGGANQNLCPNCRQAYNTSDVWKAGGPPPVSDRDEMDEEDEQLLRYAGTKLMRIRREVLRLVGQLDENGEPNRIVIFAQWNWLLSKVHEDLCKFGVDTLILDGTATEMQRTLFQFRFGKTTSIAFDPSMSLAQLDALEQRELARGNTSRPVLLLSLESTAAGLNLVDANHLFLLHTMLKDDRQTEAAQEYQAISRICRQGQRRVPTITRFIMDNTIEERLWEERKGLGEMQESAAPIDGTDDVFEIFYTREVSGFQ